MVRTALAVLLLTAFGCGDAPQATGAAEIDLTHPGGVVSTVPPAATTVEFTAPVAADTEVDMGTTEIELTPAAPGRD